MRTMSTQAERLQEAVYGAGYESAADFARALGVKGETTIRSHMNGNRNFREATARRYASKLGVSWLWLMYGEGEKNSSLPTPETAMPVVSVDQDLYAQAAKMVRLVFTAADLHDRELEAKTVAELYHTFKSKRKP